MTRQDAANHAHNPFTLWAANDVSRSTEPGYYPHTARRIPLSTHSSLQQPDGSLQRRASSLTDVAAGASVRRSASVSGATADVYREHDQSFMRNWKGFWSVLTGHRRHDPEAAHQDGSSGPE